MDLTLADVFYWVASALATVAVFGGLYAVILETTNPATRPAVASLIGSGTTLWLVGRTLRYFIEGY